MKMLSVLLIVLVLAGLCCLPAAAEILFCICFPLRFPDPCCSCSFSLPDCLRRIVLPLLSR